MVIGLSIWVETKVGTQAGGVYGFAQAAEAHTAFAKGGIRGRLVLVP